MNKFSQKTKIDLTILCCAIVAIVLVTIMIVALCFTHDRQLPAEFVPPPFDANAVVGTPQDVNDSWMPIYQDGMSFSAHVCGRVVMNGHVADVYFTNDEGNVVWMKLRVMDANGNILGETGLIKPGEYVQSIHFDVVPPSGTKISMRIMAYEPDTYYSEGAVSLNTMIH